MKDTWILFTPDPINDELGTRYEKIDAIIKCLKESFPGCKKIIKTHRYTKCLGKRRRRNWQEEEKTFLLIYTNRIGGLMALLYEEKDAGVYDLFVIDRKYDRTPVTHYSLDDESREHIIDMYKIPRRLDIRKYLNRKETLI